MCDLRWDVAANSLSIDTIPPGGVSLNTSNARVLDMWDVVLENVSGRGCRRPASHNRSLLDNLRSSIYYDRQNGRKTYTDVEVTIPENVPKNVLSF